MRPVRIRGAESLIRPRIPRQQRASAPVSRPPAEKKNRSSQAPMPMLRPVGQVNPSPIRRWGPPGRTMAGFMRPCGSAFGRRPRPDPSSGRPLCGIRQGSTDEKNCPVGPEPMGPYKLGRWVKPGCSFRARIRRSGGVIPRPGQLGPKGPAEIRGTQRYRVWMTRRGPARRPARGRAKGPGREPPANRGRGCCPRGPCPESRPRGPPLRSLMGPGPWAQFPKKAAGAHQIRRRPNRPWWAQPFGPCFPQQETSSRRSGGNSKNRRSGPRPLRR